MKQKNENGFLSVIIVVALVVLVIGAAGVSFYAKKSADDAKAKELSAQQTAAPKAKQTTKETTTPVATQTQAQKTVQPTVPTCTRDTTMYVAVSEGHALRSDKALSASKVVSVPYRAAVKVGCKDGAWYSAEYNGQVGYAYADYLSSTQPAVVSTVVGNMTQDKCLTATDLYTIKDATPVYKWSADGKVVSAGTTVPKGTVVTGGECTMWAGNVVPGYWEREAKLYSFSDLSTTKP